MAGNVVLRFPAASTADITTAALAGTTLKTSQRGVGATTGAACKSGECVGKPS